MIHNQFNQTITELPGVSREQWVIYRAPADPAAWSRISLIQVYLIIRLSKQIPLKVYHTRNKKLKIAQHIIELQVQE